MTSKLENGFYSYYLWLCMSKGVSSYAAYHAMDINKGTISKWRYAEEEARDILPSTKIAIKLSEYFDIPADKILKKQDKYGLNRLEWAEMGSAFGTARKFFGAEIKEFAEWSTLSEFQIVNFEAGKAFVPANQLPILAGVLGTDCESLFAPYAQRIFEQESVAYKDSAEVDVPKINLGDFYVTVTNDAFPPSSNGDLVAVHEQVTAENGDLVAVEVNGAQILRRYERIGDTVLLKCDNPNYQTMVFAGNDAKNVRILGKATYFIIKAV